jgi:ABC-2 type transport system ATP-binding protein
LVSCDDCRIPSTTELGALSVEEAADLVLLQRPILELTSAGSSCRRPTRLRAVRDVSKSPEGVIRPLLEVSGLSKSYGRVRALDAVSFSVRAGELLGLIGPNGAGKTSLFECLAGLIPCDAGSLRRPGSPLDDRARRELLFYLPDGIAPWPVQRLGWILDFAAGYFAGGADVRGEVVGGLSLEPLLATPMGALSKGERKRALLAIGLLTPQPLLLVDEPLDGLDLRQARDTAALLRGEASRGRTLFLSIHQVAEAARLCDRFVLLAGGRVRGEGTLAELTGRRDGELLDGAARAAALEEAFLAFA